MTLICAKEYHRRNRVAVWQTCTLVFVFGLLLASGIVSGSEAAHLVVEGPEGEREIRLERLQRESRQSLAVEEGQVRLEVHFRPGERDVAQEALHHLREAVTFVTSRFGAEAPFEIRAYLASLFPGEEPREFQSHGKGLHLILLHRKESEDRDLLEIERNALLLCSFVPHELSHVLHYKNGVFLADGWLGEGIPEYMAEQFREHHCDASLPTVRAERPPLVALHRVKIEPWKHYDLTPGTPWGRIRKWFADRREEKRLRRNPQEARAEQVATWWRYAAAGPLVQRWLQAAEQRGSDEPFRELLAEIGSRKGWVGWEESQEIALAMTGRRLPELGRVTEAELREAREQAWNLRLHEHRRARLAALSTLRHLGLPRGADAGALLESFKLHPAVDATSPRALKMLQAATGAVVAADSPEVAWRAMELLRDGRLELHRAAAPELWEMLAEEGHEQEALTRLEATVEDPAGELDERQRAAALLERLSGDRRPPHGGDP